MRLRAGFGPSIARLQKQSDNRYSLLELMWTIGIIGDGSKWVAA
jgi:hypothetical protein